VVSTGAVPGALEREGTTVWLDLPYFSGSGVVWSYTLKVGSDRISRINPDIMNDHFARLNGTLPPSPSRADHFRLPAKGQDDTLSFWTPEGFVIATWGLQRMP
jgi:hypothetical protein